MPTSLPCVLQQQFWQLVRGLEVDVVHGFEVHGRSLLTLHLSFPNGLNSLQPVPRNVLLQRLDCAVLSQHVRLMISFVRLSSFLGWLLVN
jgi:hypothetical protein